MTTNEMKQWLLDDYRKVYSRYTETHSDVLWGRMMEIFKIARTFISEDISRELSDIEYEVDVIKLEGKIC